MEEKEIEVLTFQPAKVFDYSQTEGKPLPQLVSSASRRIQHYEAFMEALQRASPVPLNGELMRENGSENTFARQETGQTQTAEACIRTMARAILQRNEKKNLEIAARDWPEVPIKQISEQIRNIEVEGISYIVCQHFGIETGENSFDCVAADCKHLDILDLESCLETINKTVGSMIFNIEKEFAETQKQEQRQANTAVKEAVEPEKKKSVLEQLKQKIKQERKRTAPRKSAERGFNMNNFTFEEMNLMCIYKSEDGTRQGLIESLDEMRGYLAADETELLALTDAAVEKLAGMTDEEFADLELYPDFYNEDDDYER